MIRNEGIMCVNVDKLAARNFSKGCAIALGQDLTQKLKVSKENLIHTKAMSLIILLVRNLETFKQSENSSFHDVCILVQAFTKFLADYSFINTYLKSISFTIEICARFLLFKRLFQMASI